MCICMSYMSVLYIILFCSYMACLSAYVATRICVCYIHICILIVFCINYSLYTVPRSACGNNGRPRPRRPPGPVAHHAHHPPHHGATDQATGLRQGPATASRECTTHTSYRQRSWYTHRTLCRTALEPTNSYCIRAVYKCHRSCYRYPRRDCCSFPITRTDTRCYPPSAYDTSPQ